MSVMCTFFGVSRSGYYDYVERLQRPEKDASLAGLLRKQQEHCFHTYGYRRMHMWLEKQGIHRNPKTILRIMKKYGLLSEIRRYRKWRQLGQQVHKYKNLLNREFYADRPNSKWVTDISYIQTGQGVLYLSMIRDLYDNIAANGESGPGHHSSGNEERETECRRRVAALQRPRISVHLASILQPDSTIRHYAFDVKERKSL